MLHGSQKGREALKELVGWLSGADIVPKLSEPLIQSFTDS